MRKSCLPLQESRQLKPFTRSGAEGRPRRPTTAHRSTQEWRFPESPSPSGTVACALLNVLHRAYLHRGVSNVSPRRTWLLSTQNATKRLTTPPPTVRAITGSARQPGDREITVKDNQKTSSPFHQRLRVLRAPPLWWGFPMAHSLETAG